MSKGRTPYDAIILREILLRDDCRTVSSNGLVYAPSHEVYKIISKEMEDRGSCISPRHVHTIVNNDRNGFKTLIMQKHGVQTPENDETLNDDSTRNATFNSSESSHSKTIKLVLSPENWCQMTPRKLISGQRVYWKFKEGWTDVIADKIVQQHGGISCVFSFKNNLVNPTATARCYATFTGFCVECKATIQGELLKEPRKDVDVIITCHIENIISEEHTGKKKRQLKGERRKKVANILIDQHKEAVTYRREEAKRLKQFGEREPATLPTCAVLRKAKEQQLLKIYGLTFSNPVTNLLHQSKCGRYAGSIHAISALKFSCIYWTREQFQIYVARCKKDPNAILTIDATGGIAQRNIKQDPYIFLYQCMLVTSEGSVPVFQMVSADQSALQIGNFLRLILSKRAPIPPIVVSDFGWALLIAVSQTFGKCSDLQDYLQKCYDIVVKESTSLPTTYIRLDVSHIVSMLARWKSLKQGQVCAVRRFYLRCLCQAYQTCDFTDLSYLLESILIVSLSEYVGYTSDGLALPAEERLHYLNDIIKGVSVEDENDRLGNPDEDCLDDDGHEPDVINTSWKMWTASLYETAQAIGRQATHGSIINACFNPGFAKQLKTQLLPYLPLWTGIMRRFFKRGSLTATSSSVEAEFNDLKNRAFKGQLPMRVDKFVFQHLDHLDGKIRLASNPSDLTMVGDKQSTTMESTSIGDLQVSPADNAMAFTIQSTNDARNQSEIQNLTDNFSIGNIKHSTPNSISKRIESVDDYPTAQTQLQTIEVSSLDCNPSGEYAMSDSVNFSHKDNVVRLVESSSDNIDSLKNIGNDSYESRRLGDLNVCENWRGMGEKLEAIERIGVDDEPKIKRAKPSYLDNCPEWEFVKDAKLGTIPMFMNGFLSGTVQMGSSKINLTRTCAFDSILQIILHTIAVNRTYYEDIKLSISPIMKLALKMLQDKKLSASHLQERAKILLSMRILKDALVRFTRNIQKLDAQCNVSHLADDLFVRDPSFIKKIECTCGYKNTRSIVMINVNVDILMFDGLQHMQRSIDDAQLMNGACLKCKNPVKETRDYGSHILIDLTVFTDKRYTSENTKRPKEIEHTLDSIASTINLGTKSYMIAGVVDYCEEHYIAYAKSGMYWSCYNDVHAKRTNANPRSVIRPHLIVYAIVQNR